MIAPRALFLFCLMALGLLFTGTPLQAGKLIYPNPTSGGKGVVGGSFVLQGVCARNGIDDKNPGIDLTRSTWACSGASSQMLQIFYQGGPQECVYIDNFNEDGGQIRAFFVPLQTSNEWIAFRQNRPAGVRLRNGCAGIIEKDACGNPFVLPDVPASDDPNDVTRVSTGDWQADYACPYTQEDGTPLIAGCGKWIRLRETGDCARTQILPVGGPGADIPLTDPPPAGGGGGEIDLSE